MQKEKKATSERFFQTLVWRRNGMWLTFHFHLPAFPRLSPDVLIAPHTQNKEVSSARSLRSVQSTAVETNPVGMHEPVWTPSSARDGCVVCEGRFCLCLHQHVSLPASDCNICSFYPVCVFLKFSVLELQAKTSLYSRQSAVCDMDCWHQCRPLKCQQKRHGGSEAATADTEQSER